MFSGQSWIQYVRFLDDHANRNSSHLLQHRFNLVNQFRDGERFALHFVVAHGVDQELAADQQPQLAEIQFGNQHFFVALEHVAQIARERIQMPQMSMGHRAARDFGTA